MTPTQGKPKKDATHPTVHIRDATPEQIIVFDKHLLQAYAELGIQTKERIVYARR